jgi:hypothetical protein
MSSSTAARRSAARTAAAGARACSSSTTATRTGRAWPVSRASRGPGGPRAPRAAEVQAARIRGAKKAGQLRLLRGRRRWLEHAGQLAEELRELIQATLAGDTEPEVARVCFYGASVLL